jgi:hypothetical protein
MRGIKWDDITYYEFLFFIVCDIAPAIGVVVAAAVLFCSDLVSI